MSTQYRSPKKLDKPINVRLNKTEKAALNEWLSKSSMTPEQFTATLELTRLKGASAESARLHLVDGLSITEAAKLVSCKRQQTNRAVSTLQKKLQGVAMTAKKIGIYFGETSLELLDIIQDRHANDGEGGMSISSATNLAIQAARIMAETPIPLTTSEILYACEICNGGTMLTEFATPDSVSIRGGLNSMMYSLVDGLNYEEHAVEQWKIEKAETYNRLKALTEAEQFALAIATRTFWGAKALGDRKAPKDFESWHDWAKQYSVYI